MATRFCDCGCNQPVGMYCFSALDHVNNVNLFFVAASHWRTYLRRQAAEQREAVF